MGGLNIIQTPPPSSHGSQESVLEPMADSRPVGPQGKSKLAMVPGEGSLLDYFDLPSPPSSVMLHRTHSAFPTPPTSPVQADAMSPYNNRLVVSSPLALNPPGSAMHMLPPHRSHYPTPPQSSPSSSASGSEAGGSPEMGAMQMQPITRTARRTAYYPPNSSRNVDRTRVYMNRGPHYMQNWTPLSSLPRHVQLRIEDQMTRFTAP
ncbi:hypothetical protein B0H63DRAFT_523184 [Podospora didyma]|uniref:Uncharacterized protein n=1 Tax=Podospora didyma TaxID=330526 RepID=A0AAE0U0A4_9PEZI|nr:hypothetical protein B0H63DRAFT_523184 [Podospora didyma]